MLKKLIFSAFFLFSFLVVSQSAISQRLYFCEDVNSDGYPISESSTFNIRNGGDYVKFLVRLPYTISCRSVSYVIYLNGDYNTTIQQDVERDWVWFWKDISFYDSGTYDIYVKDCNGDVLAQNTLRINWR